MNRRFARWAVVFAVAMLVMGSQVASATVVVVPNGNTSVPGPSNNGYPYNINEFGIGSMRYQQVYAANQFGGLSGIITRIAFRPDESTGRAFSTSGIDTEIRLSHTSKAPQGLSTTFANNIGPDETLVYGGLLSLSSIGSNSFFDIFIDIADVFAYNGTDNLLMDIKVFNSPRTTQFDSAGTDVGVGGTPYTDRLWATDVNATTGSSGGDDGYVTQFTIGAIPEPGTLAIWGVGGLCAAGAAALSRRRKASRSRPARWSDETRNAIFAVIERDRG